MTPPTPSVAAVVLAAGASTRLGGPLKQLLPLDGRPLLEHTVSRLIALPDLVDIVVVLGHAADQIEQSISWGRARTVRNPRYAEGQSTSMQVGIAALAPTVTAALFVLGDMPTLSPRVVERVLAEYAQTQAPLAQARYADRPAHPVLIARSLWPALASITGDQGARPLLHAHRAVLHHVAVPDQIAPLDIDTPDDYAALLAAWAGQPLDHPAS